MVNSSLKENIVTMAFNSSVSLGANVTPVCLLMVTEGISDDRACETWSGKQIVGTVKLFWGGQT